MTKQIMIRQSQMTATTWDENNRTCEIILATDAPVARRDNIGVFDEVLDLSRAAFPQHLPLLDSHERGSVDARIGRVDNLTVIGGKLTGRATLSRHNPKAQRIAGELSDGQTFGVSIGYFVNKWTERSNPTTKRREKVASSMDVFEASLTVFPADPHAGIRAMEIETQPAATPEITLPTTVDRVAVNQEIRQLARAAHLSQEFIDAQIDANATIEQARSAACEAMIARSSSLGTMSTASVGTDYNTPAFRASNMGEALFSRIEPSHQLSAPARAYAGLSIAELARECLRASGMQTTGLSADGVIRSALNSTSDFPMLMADTINRTLRQSYEAAPGGVRRLGRQSTAKDFRSKHRVQFSNGPELLPVNEHGEFKSGTMLEAHETYKIDTYGRIFGVTRNAMVNDDLGAFADTTRRMGIAAAEFECQFLANLLKSNPFMGDGDRLFDASHNNENLKNSDIFVEVGNARMKMRKQKGLRGEPITVHPQFILCGPDLEPSLEQLVAKINPQRISDVNPYAGTLELIVDPRLDSDWYLVASPSQFEGLEYSYLEGNVGPQIISDVGFDFDGVRFRVRLDFGAAFIDWRGWVRTQGSNV